MKTYSSKIRPIKPWMCPSLVNSIRNRDKLAALVKKHPNNETLKLYYKRTKNIVKACVRTAKDNYYKNEITKNKHDSKKIMENYTRNKQLQEEKYSINK